MNLNEKQKISLTYLIKNSILACPSDSRMLVSRLVTEPSEYHIEGYFRLNYEEISQIIFAETVVEHIIRMLSNFNLNFMDSTDLENSNIYDDLVLFIFNVTKDMEREGLGVQTKFSMDLVKEKAKGINTVTNFPLNSRLKDLISTSDLAKDFSLLNKENPKKTIDKFLRKDNVDFLETTIIPEHLGILLGIPFEKLPKDKEFLDFCKELVEKEFLIVCQELLEKEKYVKSLGQKEKIKQVKEKLGDDLEQVRLDLKNMDIERENTKNKINKIYQESVLKGLS